MSIELPKTPTPEFAPPVAVFDLDDPTAVGETLELVEQDALQLESRPLRARRILVRLGTCLVVYQSTNLKVRTRTTVRDDVMAVVAFGPRACGTMNGLPVGPECVVVGPAGVEVEFVVAAGYESIAFLLPPDDIRAEFLQRRREGDFRLPDGAEMRQTGRAARRLYGFGRRVVQVAARRPTVFDLPQARAAARREVLETLLTALASTEKMASMSRDRTRQAYWRAVHQAERYALEHAAEDVHMSDLCVAVGVSERTLQYAFKELTGMSPVAYLQRVRLHRVRKSLRAAIPGSTTVTSEALRWGFWHFGDFSRSYKACFGERPSETLRRDGSQLA